MYLSVSFISITKALSPATTMLGFVILGQFPTWPQFKWVLIIVMGTIMASLGEITVTRAGLIRVFFSEGGEAARLVATQVIISRPIYSWSDVRL